MSTLAQLVVKLVGDTSDFQKQMETASQKWTATGKAMQATGLKMSAAVTLPLTLIGTKAVDAASDLEESMNKVKVVFGGTADFIVEFSKTAATSLGMTQQAALDAAGTFGNLFTAMGIGQAQSAVMSKSLLTLAADLASFNNIDPTEALEKLRAGLVGEAEPLRTLGVNLTADSVKLKALEMGLVGAGEELDAAAKAQATYALILEQTTNAQGDFSRTSDGLANSMRIVKAQIGDAMAQLGTVLLPYVQQAVDWIRQLVERFQGLSPETQKLIVIFGVVAAAIGPVLVIVGTLVNAIGAILPVIGAVVGVLSGPVLLVIGLIVGAIILLKEAWENNWGGIRDKVAVVWSFLKGVFEQVRQWLGVMIPVVIQALANFWNNTLVPAMQTVWAFIQTKLVPIFQAIWSFISTYVIPLIKALGELLITGLKLAFDVVVAIIKNYVIPVFKEIWAFIQDKVVPVLKTLWEWIKDKLGPVLSWLGDTVLKGLKIWFDNLKAGIQAVIDWVKKLIDKIKEVKLPDWLGGNAELEIRAGINNLPSLQLEVGGGQKMVTIYGGLTLYGVQNARNLLEELGNLT